MTSDNKNNKKCGITELLVFLMALATGTGCSILSKVMMDMQGIGLSGEMESFTKPIFQTFGMFVGMTFGMVIHGIVLYFRIPFPGYNHPPSSSSSSSSSSYPQETTSLLVSSPKKSFGVVVAPDNKQNNDNNSKKTIVTILALAIPSLLDLTATALCMLGLRFLPVSLYQLLRGSGIVFVALLKQFVLVHRLYNFQWVGVAWNVVAVWMVGLTAVLSEDHNSNATEEEGDGSTSSAALLGVIFVLLGAMVQAMQYVYEEHLMSGGSGGAGLDAVPPLVLIGMEGIWGTFFSVTLLYPLAYIIPGEDHGSLENFHNTWFMVMNNTSIQQIFVLYFFVIFGYNLFAILTTYMMSSIWHAILDNFRPITIWITDLSIYYALAGNNKVQFGEPWIHPWSYLQLGGMAVLLYGTAIYNAPNEGGLKLTPDHWFWSFCGLFDFTSEYETIEEEQREAELDAEFASRMLNQQQRRKSSSFVGERSPFLMAAPMLQPPPTTLPTTIGTTLQ